MTTRVRLLSSTLVGLLAAGVAVVGVRPASRFSWLVFGPEQKVRVLARVAGTSVSLDRDGDGKFQGSGEVFPSLADARGITIPDPDGRTSYVIQRLSGYGDGAEGRLLVHVEIRGPVSFQQYCDIGGSDRPSGAPVAWFYGPLTVALQRLLDLPSPEQTLRRGDRPTDLRVNISTIDKKAGCWVVVRTDEMYRPGVPTFPVGVFPILDAEYPPTRPGDPPIRQRYPLDKSCCGSIFHGPVRVPAEAGEGKAKLRLSFDAWKAGRVAPSTIEVPIAEPQAPAISKP